MALAKHYDHTNEMKWYKLWEARGLFRPEINPEGQPYCIVIPPPNVTGSLHMGHALNATLQDILIRWQRMKGRKALWLPGTDHAGIATQNVVERELAKEGITRYDLGREKFIDRVWKWKEEYGERIITQLKRLGASCDWSRQRFTLDEGLSKAVREVFVRLFEEGLIYRDHRLINWCPRCHTALSDLEVEHEDVEGRLTYIKYPLSDGSGYVVVATTRPETMLGDTAVAVHPGDPRYRHLIGKTVKLPLTNREIPIIADEEVDPEFGTGAVKVTPAHDFNDEAIAKRQSPPLEFITVIDSSGRMTEKAGKTFAGLDRYECRKLVLEKLNELGLIEKTEKHSHSVGHCYRCKTVIEPYSTVQWYLNVKGLAEQAIKAVREGRIKIIPETWNNSYFAWMENIRDWCISRQIWWGHQIPVWYCPYCKTDEGQPQGDLIYVKFYKPLEVSGEKISEGTYTELRLRGISPSEIMALANEFRIDHAVKAICSREDPQQCPHCGSTELLRDPNVLDTWFSSALWPFSTLGWPEDTEDLRTFYPTDVLVTGFDILFFWVARMIMMGLKFRGDVPFRNVYIHALVRDSKGQKMSKSKGNVIDPLVMIDKYGSDAFRFTLAAFAAQGRDIKFSEDRVQGYKNFINKLWNATKFILMNLGDSTEGLQDIKQWRKKLDLPGRWILSRLGRTTIETDEALKEYRFNEAAHSIYRFIWHEFCDWYIEFSKPVLYEDKPSELKTATRACLLYVLERILRLLHPFMPFVTEEIWQNIPLPKDHESIMISPWPEPEEIDRVSEKEMETLQEAITSIRSIRGELNIAPTKPLPAIIKPLDEETERIILENKDYLSRLALLSQLKVDPDASRPKGSSVAVQSTLEVFVPLEGLIDIEAELRRLKKELEGVSRTLDQIDRKLMNEDFITKAPKEVVEKEKNRYNELMEKQKRLQENIERLDEVMK